MQLWHVIIYILYIYTSDSKAIGHSRSVDPEAESDGTDLLQCLHFELTVKDFSSSNALLNVPVSSQCSA
jgi:hypothetical protein